VGKSCREAKATSPRTDLGIVHLTTREVWRIEREREGAWKTPEQAQTLWKPITVLDELTISSLDPLVI
jgi:hypothetical protein